MTLPITTLQSQLDACYLALQTLARDRAKISAELSRANAELSWVNSELERFDGQDVAAIKAELAAAQAQLAATRGELHRLAGQLQAILNSTSWWLTRPIRKAGSLLQELKRSFAE